MSRTDSIRAMLYRGRDEIEERIERGIEENRKADFTLEITDSSGAPLKGVRVEAVQEEHDFLHGANLFMLDQFETPEKNQKYRELFADCFNAATVPIYWNTLEPEQGKPRFGADSPFSYRRPPIDPCLEFCESHGITPKAHCLNYDHFSPDWVKKEPVPEIKRLLVKRFRELAERYADRIPCWEVINEMLCWNGVTPLYEEPDVIEWSFRTAERFFPGNELMINEAWAFMRKSRCGFSTNTCNPYYMLVERSLKNGARIDSVGVQFHMFYPESREEDYAAISYDLKHHLAVLDRLATLGKPLEITEITIPAYHDTPEDRDLQAEILKYFTRAWFSHPAMEGMIYWNVPDGYAYNAKPGDMRAGENYFRGGLTDFSLEPKPAYLVLRDLFKKEWHTEAASETDENGAAVFRGFYGRYRVSVNGEIKTVVFRRGGSKKQTVIL
ncbi:MAG: endo-1,4-beta-xylanase [Clostridia bacterium]|nr:endo-1,4-beta-xylanase [Clostridia bacterium]